LLAAPAHGQDRLPPVAEQELASPAPVALDAAQFTSNSASELSSILSRLEALEQKNAAAEQKPAAPEKKPADDWVDLSAEKWTVKLGGHVQMDFVQWLQNEPPPVPNPQNFGRNYFEFRRLRLLADGTGYGVFDFRLQIDIEPENGDGVATPVTDVKDAYLSMNEIPLLNRWRIGNFFVPFSLEQVTNDTNNIFLERSIPTQGIFAADREVGMAIYNHSEDMNKTWTFGCFFDRISESLKERIDDNQGLRLSGRATWLPYYDELSNGRYLVHTGVGILYTKQIDNLVRFRARPQVHEGPFLVDTGDLLATSHTTGNIELATVWGPFSVQSEMFLSQVDLVNGDTAILSGGYVYGSYFLTGENRIYERFGQHGAQFARNVPYTNFFLVPGCIGSGAWEAKVRMSYLNLNDVPLNAAATNAGQYHDLTVGFNWYWSDRIRVMCDWIHPWTTQETPFRSTSSDLLGLRFDFNW
jgi:phosphate-selective porin OprO/OprP